MNDYKRHLLEWLMLHLAPGIGAGTCKRLVEHFGDPAQVLQAKAGELADVPGIRRDTVTSLTSLDRESIARQAETERKRAQQHGIHIITWQDTEYPSLLRHIHNPPMVLYSKGMTEIILSPCLAIVGSRAATSYGKSIAGKMAYTLARHGFTIVSGLALGIDAYAHQGAITGGGKTIGVLGCGLDIMYPQENRELFRNIPAAGTIISEYPLGTKPDAFRFPARNRIISGLALGVLVVEASNRSGSLITANHALEQGREVFAIPGRVDSVKSSGTHRLLQQGAKLVQTVDDIINELPPSIASGSDSDHESDISGRQAKPADLNPEEQKIITFLDAYPKNIDEIAQAAELSPQKANELLLFLELKGAVELLPGKCYKRSF